MMNHALLSIAFALCVLSASVRHAEAAGKTFNLTILCSNNGNGFSVESKDSLGNAYGGIARMKTGIDQFRAAGNLVGGVLTLDSGSILGSTREFNNLLSDYYASLYAPLKYDYVSLGSGDFFQGTKEWKNFLVKTGFKAVVSNSDDRGLRYFGPNMLSYYVHTLTIGGVNVTIGVVGIAAEDFCTQTKCEFRIRTQNIVASLSPLVSMLRQDKGVDAVVLLSSPGMPIDQALSASINGIDIICGGKVYVTTAKAFPLPQIFPTPNGGKTYAVATFGSATSVGNFLFQFVNGVVYNVTGSEQRLFACANDSAPTAGCFPQDPAVKALMDAGAAQLKSQERLITILNPVPPRANIGLRLACRSAECELGNLLSDAQLEYMGGQCDYSLVNSGNFLSNMPSGAMTTTTIEGLIFAGNTISVVQVRGSSLIDAVQISVPRVGNPQFLQFSSGMRVTYDPSRPAGIQVVNMTLINDKGIYVPVDLNGIYYVCMPNFVRGGGDGYVMFRDEALDALDNGPIQLPALISFLTARNGTTYIPAVDGRITTSSDASLKPVVGKCLYQSTMSAQTGTFTDACGTVPRTQLAISLAVTPPRVNGTSPVLLRLTFSALSPAPDVVAIMDAARVNVLTVWVVGSGMQSGRMLGPAALPAQIYVFGNRTGISVTGGTSRSQLSFSYVALYSCPDGFQSWNGTCDPCPRNYYRAGSMSACAACALGYEATSMASTACVEGLATGSSSTNVGVIVGPVVGGLAAVLAGTIAAFMLISRKRRLASANITRRTFDIGELEILEHLCDGSFGSVSKARFRGTIVAVKQLKSAVGASANGTGDQVTAAATATMPAEIVSRLETARTMLMSAGQKDSAPRKSSFNLFARLSKNSQRSPIDNGSDVSWFDSKKQKENAADQKKRIDDFLHEIDLMCTLRHPRIVLFMGSVLENNNLMILQEYMEGGSLFQALEGKPNWSLKKRMQMAM
eukprot:Opistho-2@31004